MRAYLGSPVLYAVLCVSAGVDAPVYKLRPSFVQPGAFEHHDVMRKAQREGRSVADALSEWARARSAGR